MSAENKMQYFDMVLGQWTFEYDFCTHIMKTANQKTVSSI
jgi:hypothetical protein